jgi:glycosyltransferase involved in cell wall biosynthesis
VEYLGEIGEHEKAEFLGHALALMFLINWQEPFGLVLAEAMACGTPVIAYRMGSVPEIIDDGITHCIRALRGDGRHQRIAPIRRRRNPRSKIDNRIDNGCCINVH